MESSINNNSVQNLNHQKIHLHNNEQIEKNRYILEKYLKCALFCGKNSRPLKDCGANNTTTHENNYAVFSGAIELCKGCDISLHCYLENSTSVNWTSMTIHNDLLNCILLVARQKILSEIEMVPFISIIVDGTTHVSSTVHLVVLLRYELKGKPVERFWGFFNAANGTGDPTNITTESLTQTILSEMNTILKGATYKVVAQSYGGAAVISKVNAGVKKMYPYAYNVHCHTHQLDIEMTQSISGDREVQMFFSDLSDITQFFLNSPQRVAVLDGIVGKRPSQTGCNFTRLGGTLDTVYVYRSEMMQCMDIIIETSQQTSIIKQAGSINRLLSDSVFVQWSAVFYEIMPNIHSLHDSVQTAALDGSADERIPILVQQFEKNISNVRNRVPDIIELASNLPDVDVKRKNLDEHYNNLSIHDYELNESRKKLAVEICNILIDTTKDRLKFTKHLSAVKLFQSEKYPVYKEKFPIKLLQCTFHCYPFFDKDRLRTELVVMYYRDEFRSLSGIIPTYQYMLKNNMIDTFKEVILLLRLLITVPPMTTGQENSFSTLRSIKTCLDNTLVEEILNALTMIKIENKMILDDINFSKNVINMFSEKPGRCLDFKYKT
ncbi:uncharacterized protein LOC111036406 [Myzus persicae]|uniref:uncharacterized protein LOC111036406 n=1 Tax=Myzus persicae TaxID=13164 RepID=UPI000B93610C|nr:uncharacterized protein LOC111036406 [Myzus persicae]